MSIFKKYKSHHDNNAAEELSIGEYLALCKKDPTTYATSAERMLAAIGEPEYVDTSSDNRLSRIFSNRTIKRYKSFEGFYGMEDTIEQIVGYYKHSAQGLEEKKQVLYLLGPVGGGKSSLAEHLKKLMEQYPIYVLKAGDDISPCFESPLGLFDVDEYADDLEKEYKIPRRYLNMVMSPWASKRLKEFDGDIEQFSVVRVKPNRLNQVAIAKTEPGDENNQDISALVGKVDIRKLRDHSQNDPDCYSWDGSLCRANQGIMEFVEMFKAPIKVLHPLLTATQEGNYVGTENIGAIPFNGGILAHSNESEWSTFRGNKNNEAFLDRIYIVKVPYCLRVTEEIDIYRKLVAGSSLSAAPCTPQTFEMMAQVAVLSRLVDPENSNIWSKMRIYDGVNLKDDDPSAKSLHEYKDYAGVDEGMHGLSTRFAYKVLSKVFNYDPEEVGANPVHLLRVLEEAIIKEQMGKEREEKYLTFLNEYIKPKFAEHIGKELQVAYLESYSEYGQNLFDRYIDYADHWVEDKDYKDEDTGEMFNREALNDELEKIEKPAGIANPKDFRNEVVNFALRHRSKHEGENPKWTSYEKLRVVIEEKMFANTEEILPVISFTAKRSEDDQKKHNDFVKRMGEKGYTERQTRILVDWYHRVQKTQ